MVADDGVRVQLPVADVFQPFGHVALNVCLAHSKLQALVECVTKQEAVD